MYSQSQRAAISGSANAWFDGFISVVSKSGSDYLGFGADGEGNTIRSVGPVTDLAASSSIVSMGSLSGFNYLGGGPVVQFGGSANDLAMMVHLEKFPAGGAANFHAYLGVAKSTNGGTSWTQLGDVIALDNAFNAGATTNFQDTGGGPLVVSPDGLYYYCYFKEYTGPVTVSDCYWSVARCAIADFNSDVTANTAPTFSKWQGGSSWGGSTGSNLTTLPNTTFWLDTWKDSGLGVYVGVCDSNASYPSNVDLMTTALTSPDGIRWSALTNVSVPAETVSYGCLVPTTITGNREGTGPWTEVYLAGTPWSAATVQRRQLTFASIGRLITSPFPC